MVPGPPVVEGPCRVLPPVRTVDGGHGPQTSAGRDVGVPTHWSGADNGGTGKYWGIYLPLPEHGCAIRYDPSYRGLVFGGGAENGNAPIQAMVGTARPVYHGDQGGPGSRRGGGGG